MDFSGDNLAIEIFKWVGLVFVAGFIGYFGRYLSMILIERTRRRKTAQETEIQPEEDIAASQEDSLEQQKLKVEKKKAKAGAKRLKKEGKK